jgi:hypothetical protein
MYTEPADMYDDDQTTWDYEEEPEPERVRGCLFRMGLVLIAMIVISMLVYGISPNTLNGVVQGGIDWYNRNFKYDYNFTHCMDIEREYFLTGELTYPTGGDGHRIQLFNCNHSEDPTWAELEAFLWHDQTDKTLYVERGYSNSYVCADYAEALHNNAESMGIRAGYVHIELASGGYHALNAFNTIDRGLVFIDDTGAETATYPCPRDRIVKVQIGWEYIPKILFPCFGWSVAEESMGTVTHASIHW